MTQLMLPFLLRYRVALTYGNSSQILHFATRQTVDAIVKFAYNASPIRAIHVWEDGNLIRGDKK